MDDHFDVLVLGTGLAESISAAALSKAGYRVAHVDANAWYGADEASLSPDEIVDWAQRRTDCPDTDDEERPYYAAQSRRFTSISITGSPPPFARQYSLSLAPSIIPSLGPLISSLVASGVARYGGYRLVESVWVYSESGPLAVPNSKEDVFKSKDMSLLEKRRLMRFLLFAAGEFEDKPELQGKEGIPFLGYLENDFNLKRQVAEAVAYALAYCTNAEDPVLPALHRIRQLLRSSGRYGASPFLVAHYGGAGEILQGFCRTAAVSGAAYILGRNITRLVPISRPDGVLGRGLSVTSDPFQVGLKGFDETLTCDLVISAPDYVPMSLRHIARPVSSAEASPSAEAGGLSVEMASLNTIARCIAIVDKPVALPSSLASFARPDPEQEAESSVETPPNPQDTFVLVFPPGSLAESSSTHAAHVLVTGEGSMSAPKGHWIICISLRIPDDDATNPQTLLRPYLTALLRPDATDGASHEALFSVYFIQRPLELSPQQKRSGNAANPSLWPCAAALHSPLGPTNSCSASMPTADGSPDTNLHSHATSENAGVVLVTPPLTPHFTRLTDAAATTAEMVFWEAVRALGPLKTNTDEADVLPDGRRVGGDEDRAAAGRERSDEPQAKPKTREIASFWPPLASQDEDGEEW